MSTLCSICHKPIAAEGPYPDSSLGIKDEERLETWHGIMVHAGCPEWYRDNIVNLLVHLGRTNRDSLLYNLVHEAIRNAIDTVELAELLGPHFVSDLPQFPGSI